MDKPYFCCLVCDKALNYYDGDEDDQHSAVSGLFVSGHGNYGSNYFDPAPSERKEREYLEAVICNGCVRKKMQRFRVMSNDKLIPWVIPEGLLHRTEEEEAQEDYRVIQ